MLNTVFFFNNVEGGFVCVTGELPPMYKLISTAHVVFDCYVLECSGRAPVISGDVPGLFRVPPSNPGLFVGERPARLVSGT
jgi:hypothetical protein